jgi:hypothetical protein
MKNSWAAGQWNIGVIVRNFNDQRSIILYVTYEDHAGMPFLLAAKT